MKSARVHLTGVLTAVIAITSVAAAIAPYPAQARTMIGMSIGVPPPLPHYERVVVRPGYVWAPGYWRWNGGRHVWVGGSWTSARPGYRYVPARWTARGPAWRFHAGYWKR